MSQIESNRKFSKITRSDLKIKWRPIYELYLRINNINDYSTVLAPELVNMTCP